MIAEALVPRESSDPLDRVLGFYGFFDGLDGTRSGAGAACILADPPAAARESRRDGLTLNPNPL